jgi:hypothetical protein
LAAAEAVRKSMSMIIILKTLLMIAILCFSVAHIRLLKTPQVLIKKSRSKNETKHNSKIAGDELTRKESSEE